VDKVIELKTTYKGGKTKRVARATEKPLVIRIPNVVRVCIVGVQPELGTVTLEIENVQVITRVANKNA